jgi:dTMP kinase
VLIAFEGLDQSGKQTQVERLLERLVGQGHRCRQLSFPDYTTPIGQVIGRALQDRHDLEPDLIQLLFVANRYECRPEIVRALADRVMVVCDRYVASSIAYGEAHGLDPVWLTEIQRHLPQPDLTIFLDIVPATAAGRKTADRDRYERDLALLSRVRTSYIRQAAGPGWSRIDGERTPEAVAADVASVVAARLSRP